MSSRYLKNRLFDENLKNVAMWTCWQDTDIYHMILLLRLKVPFVGIELARLIPPNELQPPFSNLH